MASMASPNRRQWLQAEQSAQEELAELRFAQLMAEMPSVEADAAFVNRTARIAWRAHTRHRLLTRCASLAATLLIVIAGVASIYELRELAVRMVIRSAVLFSHGFVWVLTSASDRFRWWWIAERIGNAVREGIADPSKAAGLAAIEILVLLAIYAFRRVLAADLGQYKPR
jgi:uncharacterized membrane protein YbaN (DUF454 family)